MAQITYRANLSAKAFPFLSSNWGRTVIVPQYDNTFNRQVASQADADGDAGIPQIFYCHNVMPTQQGFQSTGFTKILDSIAVSDFKTLDLLRDAADSKVYLATTATGKFYINDGSGWVYKATYPAGKLVTLAYVSGVTYIYIEQYGCVKYDFATGTFLPITLTSLEISTVKGITGAVGYLIAWSTPLAASSKTFAQTLDDPVLLGANTTGIRVNQYVTGADIPEGAQIVAINPGVSITLSLAPTATAAANVISFKGVDNGVAWSSSIDPTDFTPSRVTGAGGGSVEGARGAITLCVAHTLGFIAYTTNNAVAAIYSNNATYPFNFREILSSGGLANRDLVAYDANTGNHYAYTTSGFQLVGVSQTQTIFPEVTDFVSGKLFEDFNEDTNTFVQTVLTATMTKKLNVIADRYLIISYGISSLTHALVLDLSQKRWGKLKIPHVATIEYQLPSPGITEIPRQSIGFMDATGKLSVVDFSAYSTSAAGVIALGKYQFVRSRLLQIDTITVDNVMNDNNFMCILFSALDGKNDVQSTPSVLSSSGLTKTYGSRAEAINHSLLFKGSFQLNSLVLQFSVGGKR